MLGKAMLVKLYEYNVSANARILECAARVSLEQFVAETEIGQRSLQGLLFHMLRTEWVWRSLSQDNQVQVSSIPSLDDFPNQEKIKARWEAEAQLMRDFLSSLSDEELSGTVQVKDRHGKETPMVLWHMLMHLLMHSMQHRAEAAIVLTRYGQSPGDLDFIFFV